MSDPTIKYFNEILSAIAVTDCSKDSQEKIFTHKEIYNFAELTLNLVEVGAIAISTDPATLPLLKYYLSLLSQKAMGANARSAIAINIIDILSPKNPTNRSAIAPTTNTQIFEVDLTTDDHQGIDNYKNIKMAIATVPDKKTEINEGRGQKADGRRK